MEPVTQFVVVLILAWLAWKAFCFFTRWTLWLVMLAGFVAACALLTYYAKHAMTPQDLHTVVMTVFGAR